MNKRRKSYSHREKPKRVKDGEVKGHGERECPGPTRGIIAGNGQYVCPVKAVLAGHKTESVKLDASFSPN